MKSAITLSQVPEAAAGPFVFHQSLPEGFSAAKKHGYDSVELFLPGPDFISTTKVKALASEHELGIAAIGTGAGMVKHGLSLTDVDAEVRSKALDFIIQMIEFGGELDAPAILGSMQGKWGGEVSREQALNWLAEALRTAGEIASKYNVPFIYEPLNRYETNLINHLEEGAKYIEDNALDNIVLLANLFHMKSKRVTSPKRSLQQASTLDTFTSLTPTVLLWVLVILTPLRLSPPSNKSATQDTSRLKFSQNQTQTPARHKKSKQSRAHSAKGYSLSQKSYEGAFF